MSRLPIVGNDLNAWGALLNDFLSQSLDMASGAVKTSLNAIFQGTTLFGTTFVGSAFPGDIVQKNQATHFYVNAAGTGLIQALSATNGNSVILGNNSVSADLQVLTGGTGDITLKPGGIVTTSTRVRLGSITGGAPTEVLTVIGSGSFEPTSGTSGVFVRFLDPQASGKNWRTGTGAITAGRFEIQNTSDSASAYLAIDTAARVILTGTLCGSMSSPTYSASITISGSDSGTYRITATNGTAFTVGNPTNPPPQAGQVITIMIKNTSGGPLGAVTWDTLYKLSAWTSPANGFSRSISFLYDGTNWVEVSRTPNDVPN